MKRSLGLIPLVLLVPFVLWSSAVADSKVDSPGRPGEVTFYFASGSVAMIDSTRKRIANYANSRQSEKQIRVAAHTDACEVNATETRPCQSRDARVALAKRRAAVVRDELVKDGIDADRIHIDTSSNPAVWTDPDGGPRVPYHRYVTLYDF